MKMQLFCINAKHRNSSEKVSFLTTHSDKSRATWPLLELYGREFTDVFKLVSIDEICLAPNHISEVHGYFGPAHIEPIRPPSSADKFQ